MTDFYTGHSKAFVSVDVIIFGFDHDKLKILLGHRNMDPGRGEWALYGGFVNIMKALTRQQAECCTT